MNFEEGKEIECALNVLEGKTIYRDFFWQYGPLSPYAIALLFKVFGSADILVPRAMVSALAVLTAFYSYRAARFYLPPSWAFWAALMSSSGLAAREGTYGHGFAYWGMIASFYYLLRFLKGGRDRKCLAFAGLAVSLALLGKPVAFGAGAVVCAVCVLSLWSVLHEEKPVSPGEWFWFLVPALLPAVIVFGYLFARTPSAILYASLFPMTSGTVRIGHFNLKRLVPPIPHSSFAVWVDQMNLYLVDDLRWWTIVLVFLGGALFVARRYFLEKGGLARQFLLVVALGYSLLIEVETLLWVARPITFYINMFPTYVLLAVFFKWAIERFRVAGAVYGVAFSMCAFYFFYSPVRSLVYYWNHAEPLGLKYAETVRVPDYTRNGYWNIAQYVKEKTPSGKPILFASYDSFVYLFSDRPALFPEDFAIFVRASFSLYHYDYPQAFFDDYETKLVEKVRSAPPPVILVPAAFLTGEKIEKSIFLKYLVEHWRRKEVLNAGTRPGPFDTSELVLAVFAPKEPVAVDSEGIGGF